MTQYALPDADGSSTNWTEGAGDGDGFRFDELDEGFGAGRGSGSGPDDATTYWASPNSPALETIACELESVTDPEVSTGHIYRTRNRKSASGGRQIDVLIRLWNSGFVRVSQNFANIDENWTTRPKSLSAAQADSLTSYSDLRVSTEANFVGGGAPRAAWESAFEFECPDAAGPRRIFITHV